MFETPHDSIPYLKKTLVDDLFMAPSEPVLTRWRSRG